MAKGVRWKGEKEKIVLYQYMASVWMNMGVGE